MRAPCETSVAVAGIKGEPDMRIFSICCVRGENDIVGETLKAALDWSDQIFVFDNGSTDGTWEMLQDLAKCYPKIELVGHDDRTFTDELCGEIFEARRYVALPGDWWCSLDADEFFIDDPAQFLRNVPQSYGFVLSATMNFHFTDADLKSYEENPCRVARPSRARAVQILSEQLERAAFRSPSE